MVHYGLIVLFHEFFVPFNLLGEPFRVVAVELILWFFVVMTEGIVISKIYTKIEGWTDPVNPNDS